MDRETGIMDRETGTEDKRKEGMTQDRRIGQEKEGKKRGLATVVAR